ncbi:MBL fold metallo-hydrolase [Chryseobacterium sp. KCF3-3]|uniref:MBL fold metallo-hydrolase n=1 Tax=Chryseobacterium sp. KCF3-3 TaxID=3231511 RepID=UPI0038B40D74
MKIEQIYTKCLAHAAYYITSNGEAAIIDPLREIQPYLDKLAADDVKLKYIFETHFHADFVSGHLDLSGKTNASIIYGPTAEPEFKAIIGEDGQVFNLGDVKIKLIHTPGHTMESTCFLLIDKDGKETAIFSGDTLFLGDVGRPDLAQEATHKNMEELAGILYESLYKKIIPLSDDIVVYPGHGKGSACGKKMMSETVDTLGNQKRINYALNQPHKESFVKAVTDGLLPPPGYFGANAAMNRQGYEHFENVFNRELKALSIEDFKAKAIPNNVLILDSRNNIEFAKGYIPGSVNIGLDGNFAQWVGEIIIDVRTPVLLITEVGKEEETIIRLGRIGFDNVLGYLDGGFYTWKNTENEINIVNTIASKDFVSMLVAADNDYEIIDVRQESEYGNGHIKGAINMPLNQIHNWINEIDSEKHFYMYCQAGYRSIIASSFMILNGYCNFTEVQGGINEINSIIT